MPYSSTPMFGSGDSLSPELLAQLQAAYTPQNSGAFDWASLFSRPTFGGLQMDPIYDSPDGSGSPTRWMARDPNNKNPEAYYHTYDQSGKYAGDYQGTKQGILDGPLIPLLAAGGMFALGGGLGGLGGAGASGGGATGAGAGFAGDATAAGYGGLDAASAATMGGGASINGGAALGSMGGAAGLGGAAGSAGAGGASGVGGGAGAASSGLSGLLSGNGGTIAKLAAGLLGAALGGKSPSGSGTGANGSKVWDSRLDPYIYGSGGALNYAQGLLNRPVADNAFKRYYGG